MKVFIPLLLGVTGAAIANLNFGFTVSDYQWWITCAPFWLIGSLIVLMGD